MTETLHQYATVDGHRIFYREAGPRDAPTVVLLHGFPTGSRMFRRLIPELADRFHVIAPDHVGFGHSDIPSVDEFPYTFDALTDVTERFPGAARDHRLRPLRTGLRRPPRMAARAARSHGDHRRDHPERKRLRGRLRRGFLGARVGLRE
ncbi:hypothetical protein GCM10023238_05980 [Streptomyces heliomycini]